MKPYAKSRSTNDIPLIPYSLTGNTDTDSESTTSNIDATNSITSPSMQTGNTQTSSPITDQTQQDNNTVPPIIPPPITRPATPPSQTTQPIFRQPYTDIVSISSPNPRTAKNAPESPLSKPHKPTRQPKQA